MAGMKKRTVLCIEAESGASQCKPWSCYESSC